jgi:hypothetical protein
MSDLIIGVGTSVAAEANAAVGEALAIARRALGGREPGLALITSTVEHRAEDVHAALRRELPSVPIHGATSCLGVIGGDRVVSGPGGAVGVALFASAGKASFAVGSASLEGGGRAAGRAAAEELLPSHGGAQPKLILLAATPGEEEAVLAGIAEIYPEAPVYGGSAADHAIAGDWSIYTDRGARREGVTLAAIFGDMRIGGAFGAPYRPAETSATVTEAAGRTLRTLGGEPAGAVLQRWVGDDIAEQVREGGNLLVQTALRPLGQTVPVPGGTPFHLALHPAFAHPGGAIDLFAVPTPGATLCPMSGTPDALVGIVESLAAQALTAADLRREDVRGAFLVYCAGCAGALGPRVDEAIAKLSAALGGVPLLGTCSFGEQGRVPSLGNVHANLSVAVLLFG